MRSPGDPAEPTDVRQITTPPGGIMTDEVGVITGPVEIWLDEPAVRIRYQGALDTYTVTGHPADKTLDDIITTLTTDPGVDSDGNPKPASLLET